jgi:TetR/AcrR family transcriptional regulator
MERGGLDSSRGRFDINRVIKPHGSTTKSKRSPVEAAERDRETRERILDAAHAVFLRKGTANSRTHEIAAEAGVNKALLHYYFGTKAALADAIFERSMAAIMPRIFGILADEARTIEQKVRDIAREQIDFHSARPYLAGYVVSEMHAEPDRVAAIFAKSGRPPLDVIRRQIREAVKAGTMRSISAEQFVVNLMGLLVFPFALRPVLSALLGMDPSSWAAFIEERRRLLPDFILAGLRP